MRPQQKSSRAWQLQEAKAKFSELVKRAIAGQPQTVTHRGKEAVVVVAVEQFRRQQRPADAFKKALFGGPSLEGLELERSRERSRKVKL